MTSITLFAHPDSGHSYKVKLALAVAGLAPDYRVIDIHQPHAERPEPFRSLAPFGEVPLLLLDGQPHAQSNAILCVLAEHTQRWGGESPQRMAACRQWLFWEANRLGLSLPHLRFARFFEPASYQGGAVTWLTSRFEKDIGRLAHEFADGRRFILDDQPSMADFSLCGYLFWADQIPLPLPPRVTQWLDRIRQLPGWAEPHALLASA